MIKVTVNVDAPDDLLSAQAFGAGARIRIERATAENGAYAEVGTVALLATQTSYEWWDAGGDESHWYRWRVSKAAPAGGADHSGYSDPFRGVDATDVAASRTYATVEDLRQMLSLPGDKKTAVLQELLESASRWIEERCRRTFFRAPQVAGTETRRYNGSGTDLLRDVDIVELTSVEIASGTGGTFSALAAGQWFLEPSVRQAGWPYESLRISEAATGYRAFTRGQETVRLTGAFGWPAVPGLIRTATLDLARESYRQGPGGGGPVGVNQFGTPIFGGGMPGSVRDAIATYRRSWGVS